MSVCLGDLEAEDRHHAQVQHSIGILQRDMVRLSTLITEKQGKQEELEQHNALMEKGFVINLKVCSDMHSRFCQCFNVLNLFCLVISLLVGTLPIVYSFR